MVDGFDLPTSLAFLPDGRAIVVELRGGVKLVPVDGDGVVPLLTIPNVLAIQEAGLLGVAVDPSWPSRPFVYVFYNKSPQSMMRLERYTASGDLMDPASEELTLGSPYLVLPVFASLRILDASGRIVRSLDVAAGSALRWDGRDGSGRVVPPGVYFLSVRDAQGVKAGRVSVLP